MTTSELDKIIEIIDFIIKNDPCDSQHLYSNWEIKKFVFTNNTPLSLKSYHMWYVENNTNADYIIKKLTDKKVVYTINQKLDLKDIKYIVFTKI